MKHNFLMFLEKDATWHDYIELLEFGMQFQQVNLKQLPRVVFLKTQDAHRARASELESTGTARSIRCRNWHQVETDWKRRISELNIFDVTTCQNLSKLFRQLIAAGPGARVPSLRRAATWDAHLGVGSHVFGGRFSTFGPQCLDMEIVNENVW